MRKSGLTKDTRQKLSVATITLHWLVGAAIIALLAVGWYMAKYEVFFLYPIHKSVGILVVVAVLARVWWRAINGFPQPLGNSPTWQRRFARISHYILLIGSIAMPLSGMVMSAMGGHGLDIFGLELFAKNIDPTSGRATPINEFAAKGAHIAHYRIGRVMMAVIVLHLLGALKHHLIDKDGTLLRMLGRVR